MRSRKALNSALHETRDFKTPRRRRQQERQKSNWLNKQNNNSARAPRLLVHFFTVTATTRGKCLNSRFMKEVNKQRLIFCFFLNLNMILWNSAQKEFACISQSKRVRVMRVWLFFFRKCAIQLLNIIISSNHDRDWKNANSLFKRRFRGRSHRGILNSLLINKEGFETVLGTGWKYSRLPITRTLAYSNQNRFPLDFRRTFTIILPSVTRTLDNSNSR